MHLPATRRSSLWPIALGFILLTGCASLVQREAEGQAKAGQPEQAMRTLEDGVRKYPEDAGLRSQYLRLRDNMDIELRFIAIPDDWRPPVKGAFKKETMASLAELGCKLGADPNAWRTDVPNPESPEH